MQRDRVGLLSDEKQEPDTSEGGPEDHRVGVPGDDREHRRPEGSGHRDHEPQAHEVRKELGSRRGIANDVLSNPHDSETGVRDQTGDPYEREDSDIPTQRHRLSEIPREERDGGERQRNRREIASDTEHPAPDQEPLRLG